MPRGVSVIVQNQQADYEEILLVRGRLGVYEFPWSDRVGQALLDEVVVLENLLFELAGPPVDPPGPVSTVGAGTNLMGTVTITETTGLTETIETTPEP